MIESSAMVYNYRFAPIRDRLLQLNKQFPDVAVRMVAVSCCDASVLKKFRIASSSVLS
ncbi:hypothetical protein KIN20_020050 [Parelaphostrongylus tenuis]|uniref:Uncharacterized protein n=1 Tax=Parelaphostrongylus tenuis TaxID=148309 RepID=A0AAD5QSY0_PARTN|nr:hypothetical protein KIN20_020050 [Parelaphostrongylus tenuis]